MRLWNIGNGTLAGRFERHGEDLVLGAAFSPDGTQIITGSYDHMIRLWDVANKSLLSTFPQYHFETWIGTGGTSDNEIPDSIVALYDLLRTKPNMLTLLGGWIKIASSSKRLWIPPRYRGAIATNAGRVCIGTTTGHVVIVETLKD
jgi:WD40 repeat protein